MQPSGEPISDSGVLGPTNIGGVTPTAWKMYKYSLLYLALLFAAMGIDRALPFGHRYERSPILILDQPEVEAIGAPDGGR